MTRDPHAQAYEVLFQERSIQMQKNLKRSTPAHHDPQCLRCHVGPGYDDETPPENARYFKTDGVSCESCHGPAHQWLPLHHLEGWRHKSAEQKKRLGMNDTRSLLGRTKLCASCHVGSKDMDVDHDLLAAGHPRLHYEFTAFHEHMPRHWPDSKDRGKPHFEARAWTIGQLVTAQAALELLSTRARTAAKVWPEFAEFDCASCHRALQASGARLGIGDRRPGSLPWGHQVALAATALRTHDKNSGADMQLDSLRKLMANSAANRARIAGEAHKAAAALKELLERADAEAPYGASDIRRLRDELLARGATTPADSDAMTQIHLALAAIAHPRASTLAAPALRSFDPDAIRARLSLLKVR
jgi:hypothetical protein